MIKLLLMSVFLSFFVPNAVACSCIETSISDAYDNAAVIFLGTVTSFRQKEHFHETEIRVPNQYLYNQKAVLDINLPKFFLFHKYYFFYRSRETGFQINKIWKGPQQETITIFTGTGGGDCGYDFIVGHEYLVYASQDSNGNWSTNICERTREVSEGGADIEDIKFLDAANK